MIGRRKGVAYQIKITGGPDRARLLVASSSVVGPDSEEEEEEEVDLNKISRRGCWILEEVVRCECLCVGQGRKS